MGQPWYILQVLYSEHRTQIPPSAKFYSKA